MQLMVELAVTGLAYDGLVRSDWESAISIAIVGGKASFMSLAMLPMLVELTYMIPHSVESSMASLFYACLNFSYDWGGKFMTAIMFGILGVGDDAGMVYLAVRYKIIMLISFLLLTLMLPSS